MPSRNPTPRRQPGPWIISTRRYMRPTSVQTPPEATNRTVKEQVLSFRVASGIPGQGLQQDEGKALRERVAVQSKNIFAHLAHGNHGGADSAGLPVDRLPKQFPHGQRPRLMTVTLTPRLASSRAVTSLPIPAPVKTTRRLRIVCGPVAERTLTRSVQVSILTNSYKCQK